MRIVAGEHRGRRLRAPAGSATRPTSDRVREALFSILGPVDGLDVLDLYAGSGALGVEDHVDERGQLGRADGEDGVFHSGCHSWSQKETVNFEHLMAMTLSQLRTFLAVADAGWPGIARKAIEEGH